MRVQLTKWRSGREIDSEVVTADNCTEAVLNAGANITDNERGFISYTAAPAEPVCGKCGSDEFQIVEDVPHLFRDHEFIDGVLQFNTEQSHGVWDCSGERYRYVECRKCCTRLDDVDFSYEDDPDRVLQNVGDPHEIAIVLDGGLVREVFATCDLDVEYLDCPDFPEPEEIKDFEWKKMRREQIEADERYRTVG